MTDADYADDLALLANKPSKTESVPHKLEPTTEDIAWMQIKLATIILNKKESNQL